MSLTSATDKKFGPNYEALVNATNQIQPENLNYIRETTNLLARKKIIRGDILLKLRKKIMQPTHTSYGQKTCRKQLVTTSLPTSTVATPSYHYLQDYNYPIAMNDWHPLQTPLLTVRPLPVIIPTTSPVFTTRITPLVGAVQPVLSSLLPQTFLQEDVPQISNYTSEFTYCTKQIEELTDSLNNQYYIQDVIARTDTILNSSIEAPSIHGDPIEPYLKLPKELFPTPNMLALDPNPIIDEFCKMPNLQRHMPWLLDLEFGIPKSPITRPIPTYNVKFNSIHCKNAPDAIHPGFESCDPDFKKILLFYYDCVVSSWYRGYMIMHCDRSVENFQSWLLLPMQDLGMCWP